MGVTEFYVRTRMRRPLIFILGAILTVGLLLVGWLSSDGFDAVVRHRLQESLLRVNLRSTVAAVDLDLLHRTLRITGLRLFPGEQSEPVLDVQNVRVMFKVRDFFRRDILLEDVEIAGARLHIITDEKGRPNIEAIDLSSLRQPGKKAYTVKIGRLMIREGEIEIRDRRYPVELRVHDFSMSVQPVSSRWQLEARSADAELVSGGGRTWQRITRLELSAQVDQRGVSVQRLRLLSDGVDLLGTGHIAGWDPPRYDFDVCAQANLSGWAEAVMSQGQGIISLRGRIVGTGSDYRIEGGLETRRAAFAGVTLGGLMTHLTGSSDAAPDSRAFAASMRTTADLLFASLFRIRHLDLAARIVGPTLIGQLRAPGGNVGLIPVEDVRVRFRATANHLQLEEMAARTLNGRVRGEGIIRFSDASRAVLEFQDVSLAEVARLLSGRHLPIAAVVSGRLSVTWPGLSLGRLRGHSRAIMSAPPAGSTEALPVAGEMTAAFTGSTIALDPSRVVLGETTARVNGRVSGKGDFDLHLDGASGNLAELEKLLAAWGHRTDQLTRGVVPRLAGSGRFDLSVSRAKHAVRVSGSAELKDILVGSEPVTSLRSEFLYDGSSLELTHAEARWASGASADFSLRLVPGSETGISLRGRCVGVDIRGWARLFQRDFPLAGRLTATANLDDLPSAPHGMVEGTLTQGELRLGHQPISFTRATGQVEIERSRYRLSRVTVAAGGGTIRLAGWVDMSVKEFDLSADARDVVLGSLLEASGLDIGDVNGRLSGNLTGSGTLSQPQVEGRIRLTEVVIRKKAAGRIEAEFRRERGRTTFTVEPTLFGQTWRIEGGISGTEGGAIMSARTRLDEFDLAPYLDLAGVSGDIKAVVSGAIDASVPVDDLNDARVRAEISRLTLQLGEYALTNRRTVSLEFHSTRAKIEAMSLSGENTDLDVAGVIDLVGLFGSPGDEGLTDLTLGGRVDLRLLRTFYPNLFASGRATVRATVRGSFTRPRLSGVMDIADASLRLVDWPIALVGGEGRIRFTADQALIEGLRAQVNGGDLALSGGLILRNLKADRWRLVMKAEGVQITYPAGFRSLLDGDLVLQGNRQVQVLSGTVDIRRSEYHENVDLAQLILASKNTLPMPRGIEIKPPMTLDVRVQGLDTVVVRNNLADVVGSAWLHVGGTLGAPRLTGTAIVTRGTLRFRDRDYQITRGRIDFPETLDSRPRFTVEAETDIRGYRVIVTFLGTLDRFQTSLRSEPTLTVDEIVSLITTGDFTPSRGLTSSPAASSVGTAANLLFSELTHRAEEFTGKLFGINRFQLDPLVVGRGSDPTARITIGRQVTRDLSILYSTNLSSTQEQVVIVEYRLSNRFSLVGVRDQDGNFSFDLRIRKRF